MPGDGVQAGLLGVVIEHEQGADRADCDLVVVAGQVEIGEVGLQYADPVRAGVGAELGDHRAAGLDPVYR